MFESTTQQELRAQMEQHLLISAVWTSLSKGLSGASPALKKAWGLNPMGCRHQGGLQTSRD